jgi:hypothetical protein
MRTIIAALSLLACFLANSAYADGENICQGFEAKLQHSPAIVNYVRTGDIASGFTPGHSRAFFASVLGMTKDLKGFLGSTPKIDSDMVYSTVDAGQQQSLRILLDLGVSPDLTPPGYGSPLALATQCHMHILMTYLIMAGADIYAQPVANIVDPMQAAVAEKDEVAVQLLLAAGYDP